MNKEQYNDGLEVAYEKEIKKLELLSGKLNGFLKEAVNNYPTDEVRKYYAFCELIKEILTRPTSSLYTSKDKYLDALKISENLTFKKPNDGQNLKNGQSEKTGFNIDDVLNPKEELDLMSLCKELGVTD